jgi:hypothetical protein
MHVKMLVGTALAACLAACGPRDEFPHQTIEAYQADEGMRQSILQKCADHITAKSPFATEADTDECRKAYQADQNVALARHLAKEHAASEAAMTAAMKQFEGK